MALPPAEKIKLYIVIGLSCVAAVMAYFTFVRKPDKAGPVAESGAADSMYEIPVLPDWLDEAAPTPELARSTYRAPSRSLFAPIPDAPRKPVSPQRKFVPFMGPPRLTAIMTGRMGAVAVINGTIMKEGQSIGEYTITEIGHDHAVLVQGESRLVLKVGK